MKGGGNHLKDSEDLPIKNNHHHHHNGITTKPLIWDQMAVRSPRIPSSSPLPSSSPSRAFPRLMYWLIFLITLTYLLYTAKLLFSSSSSSHHCIQSHLHQLQNNNNPETFIQISTATATASPVYTANSTATAEQTDPPPTPAAPSDDLSLSLHHIVFGIAASARYWEHRKNYTKIWWRPDQMRGIVWVDSPVKTHPAEKNLLPPVRISSDTSRFPYSNKQGHRSAIRISRIVSETLRLGLADVRWFVMGDDDTVFVADNLVRVLSKYDHRQPYYIGSLSESHLQNIHFSYGMAYGGGGFAISHPLAVTLGKMQDRCIHRYPGLYGSDDRIQACMAELGVPLTKEPGFHQYDVYGNLFGLLAAHPVAPLVTLHHLDVVEPVFPNATRVAGLRRIFDGPVRLDSAGVMQQSICYEGERKWTVSVSWGFAVQIIRGVLSPREMEMPARTFLNWYRRADYTAYAFNTRPVARNPCQKPFMYYLSAARFDRVAERTVTEYRRHSGGTHPRCKWKMAEPSAIDRVVVYKRPDPSLWSRSPRRNCCRILASGDRARGKSTMTIDVGLCREGEISEI